RLGDPPVPVLEPFAGLLFDQPAPGPPAAGGVPAATRPAAGLHHDARPPASHGPADARRTCRRAARARPARLFPALVAAEALGFHRSTTQRQRVAAEALGFHRSTAQRQRVAAGGTRASTPRADVAGRSRRDARRVSVSVLCG